MNVVLCKTKDEFCDFIDNFEGELRIKGCQAWHNGILVAVIVKSK